jgi:acyl-CoA synthetase (AMP-forming)/AMP-acid ligase II
MFKVKGATVFPTEVEAALRAIDGVRLVYVTDVRDADGTAQVGAFVVCNAAARAGRRGGATAAERLQGAEALGARLMPSERAVDGDLQGRQAGTARAFED